MIRAELRKLLTVASTWWMLMVLAGFGALLVRLVRLASPGTPLWSVVPLALAGPVAVGAALSGQEYVRQHASTLVAMPRRAAWRAGRGLVFLVATTPTCAIAGWLIAMGEPGGTGVKLGLAFLVCAVMAWLLADIFRATMAGLVGGLLVVWVLPLAGRALDPQVGRYLPSSAISALGSGNLPHVASTWTMAAFLAGLAGLAGWRGNGDVNR